jgi:hypothetical protein
MTAFTGTALNKHTPTLMIYTVQSYMDLTVDLNRRDDHMLRNSSEKDWTNGDETVVVVLSAPLLSLVSLLSDSSKK